MREVLFRGKREKDEQWEYGAFWQSNSSIIDKSGYSQKVIPETVGQYTGLTDKNGKKIFEGDICKHRSNASDNFVISVVTYTDGHFLALVDKHSGFELSEKLEGIGNIHDNPELLKGGVNNA